MNWWRRIKAWFAKPDPREAEYEEMDAYLRTTQPIPSEFPRISEATNKRMLDEVPDSPKEKP